MKKAGTGSPSRQEAQDPDLARLLAKWMAQEGISLRDLSDPSDMSQRLKAAAAAGKLFQTLSRSPRFSSLSDAVRNAENGGRPWHWLSLFDSGRSRAGIMFLKAGRYVPFHDHPGALGVSFVASGEVEIVQCDSGAGIGSTPYPEPAESDLAIRWFGRLGAGDATFLTATAGNIHSFTALADTMILDLFVNAYPYRARSWFVPVAAPMQDGTIIPASRHSQRLFSTPDIT